MFGQRFRFHVISQIFLSVLCLDEDELYVRYVLGKEPLENVLNSLKKNRELKEARKRQEENQPSTSEGINHSEPAHDLQGGNDEGSGDVYDFQSNDDSD